MSRYIGNYLRVPSSEPQQASASGIWSINEQLAYQRANQWPPARDPYYNQTVLHLSGDVAGTRETNPVTQPRTFLSDASTNNFLLTPNGDVSARPFNPYTNSYGNYFGGSSDFLRASVSALSSSSFTVEAWIYFAGASTTIATIYDFANATNGYGMYLVHTSPGNLTAQFYSNNTGTLIGQISTNFAGNYNKWVHVAVSYDGSTYRLFVGGFLVGTPVSSATQVVAINTLTVGARSDSSPTQVWLGYISNLRYVTGSALYTANFTPSISPLGIAGTGITRLLTCQSNRFIDNSSSPLTLTVTGSPAVSQNSPFADYDTTSGSGYFDGSGDYLETGTVSSFNFLHSPSALFTVQCWVYIPSVISSGSRTIIATTPNSGGVGTTWTLEYYNSAVYMNLFIARGVGGVWVISGYSTSAFTTYNQWTHLAVTYDQSLASNNATFYINGQPVGTASKLANAPSSSNASYPLHIGRVPTASMDFNGYIADLHISNSILPITVPTIPQKLTSSTQLLTLQTRAPANNQGILDTSPNSFVVTRTGNVAQGSFSPFSPTGWGNYFSGSSTYLQTPSSSAFDFGSNSFTIEAFIYLTSATTGTIIGTRTGDTSSTIRWVFYTTSAGNLECDIWNTSNSRIAGFSHQTALQLNAWQHVALVRNGSDFRLYLNGVQSTSNATSSTAVNNSILSPTIAQSLGGSFGGTNAPLVGYLSNLRVVKDQALYTGNFTPPTAALTTTSVGTSGANVATSVTGTVGLLTCQSNRFLDQTGKTITVTGSPSVQPFSPFAPTQAYVASQIGGSLRVSASGDIISWPQNTWNNRFSSNNWSIEAWVYPTASTSTDFFVDQWTNGTTTTSLIFTFMGGNFDVYIGSTLYTLTGITPTLNAWTHIVAVRTGGTFSVFQNGVRTHTRSDLGTGVVNNGGTANRASPGFGGGAGCFFHGHRIVIGSNVPYDATNTVIPIPTAPVTAIPGTASLLLGTGAGIVDSTGRNNLETVANSGVQTSQAKWSPGSMYFDGTGDGLFSDAAPTTNAMTLGTGDFCIEFWVYFNSLSGTPNLLDMRPVATQGVYPNMYVGTSKVSIFVNSADLISGTTTLSTGQWYHIAWSRISGQSTLYVGGTRQGASSTADTNNYLCSRLVFGIDRGLSANPINAYFDDIRITKGNGRGYTGASITVPTGPFPLA